MCTHALKACLSGHVQSFIAVDTPDGIIQLSCPGDVTAMEDGMLLCLEYVLHMTISHTCSRYEAMLGLMV